MGMGDANDVGGTGEVMQDKGGIQEGDPSGVRLYFRERPGLRDFSVLPCGAD